MAGAVRDEVSTWWVKADETPGGALVRCVELVPDAMRREGLSLSAGVDRVCDALASACPGLPIFGLREGYAQRLELPRLPSPADGWQPGMPVPDGYREVSVYARQPPQGRAAPRSWGTADSVQLARPVRRVEWAGEGPEPEHRQTPAEWMENVRRRWKALASTGNLDAASGRPLPHESRLAIQRGAAVVLGLADAAMPDDDSANQWGPLRVGPEPAQRLASVVDVLRHVMRARDLPQVPAWEAMRDALVGDAAAVTLYQRQRADFAKPLPADAAVPVPPVVRRVISAGIGGPAVARQPRTVGVVEWLGLTLAETEELAASAANIIALSARDALRLFGYVPAVATVAAAPAHAVAGIADAAPGETGPGLGVARFAALHGEAASRSTWYACGADGQSVPVLRLVDLLGMLGPVHAMPPAALRADMTRRLEANPVPLYLATERADSHVKMMPSDEVWRPPLMSGDEKWRAVDRDLPSSFLDFTDAYGRRAMYPDEAVWRGVSLGAVRGGLPVLDGELVRLLKAEWEALPALPELRGAAGALEAFCLFLADGVERAAPDMVRRVRELAITEADARRLFPEAFDSLVAPVEPMGRQVAASRSGGAVAEVVLPAGGAWPHSREAKWTHAERDAMFEMRHRLGMTNKSIAAAVGAESEQTITNQIGSKDAWKRRDWSGAAQGWKPSPDLLARCGLDGHGGSVHQVA